MNQNRNVLLFSLTNFKYVDSYDTTTITYVHIYIDCMYEFSVKCGVNSKVFYDKGFSSGFSDENN